MDDMMDMMEDEEPQMFADAIDNMDEDELLAELEELEAEACDAEASMDLIGLSPAPI